MVRRFSQRNKHFAAYSQGQKQVTQLVISVVWKLAYAYYFVGYLDLLFQEDPLKDRLRDTLKDLKMGTNNEAHGDMTTLQSDEVLVQLKTTYGHTTHNVLKCRQDLIDWCFPTHSTLATINIPEMFEGPTLKRSPSHISPSTPPIEKFLTNHEMLAKTDKCICALTKHVVRNLTLIDGLVEAKEIELRSKASAFKAREELERPKSLFAHEIEVSQRLGNLEREVRN